MRRNPLITEVLVALARGGKAELEYLPLLLLQTAVLVLWWPGSGVAQMLEFEHAPRALAAVVMALGFTLAYAALRAGAEEFLLEGQHGLRHWARAMSMTPDSIVRGYLAGQLLQSLHLLVLSSPLLLVAFTVSGGEWAPLAWCLAAAVVQALCYRLCGAIAYLTLGSHPGASFYAVRAMLLLGYAVLGWAVPGAGHLALTYRTLGADGAAPSAFAAMPDPVAFLALYAALSVAAALAVHRLLARAREATKDLSGGAGASEALPG